MDEVQPGALVVGESLVDVVRRAGRPDDSEHPGGSAANVAVALARLGRPVRLATAWADDPRGAVLADHLAAAGVELLGDPRVLDRTSTAVARIGADGAADYAFDLDWRLGSLPPVAPLAVHACSLGAVLEPGAAQVRRLAAALRPTAAVTYDVNARPALTGTGADVVAAVEAMAALADVVKASDEDLAALWPGRPEEEVLRRLLALGPAAVVVTRGSAGASVTTGGGRADVASGPAEVVDTIGAGDTFQAALVDALWERGLLGADRRAALTVLPPEAWVPLVAHAARAAAVTVSRAGADPPYRHELG